MKGFTPKTLDYKTSPYTGLTRQSWIEAGEYFLTGIFQHMKSMDDPLVMPRKETKVTYPHSEDAVWEKKAEYFEGLARSFFIAAPLLREKPDLRICGFSIRDYYKNHVLRICSKHDPYAAGRYEELLELARKAGDQDAFKCFQQTVETGALVICLWISKEAIWDTYTKEEKDTIAEFLTGFAHGNTVPQNWRLFNMLDLAFLHMEGYPIDQDVMRDHAQAIYHYYAGDGWYRDGQSFDYYAAWGFQLYLPIWNLWYGYQEEPELARLFEERSNAFVQTYPDFFDRDGYTNMWGRSNIYRNASTSALVANMFLRHSEGDPGLARRICSGSLMQFLSRDDFLYKGIPALGFYGQFMPLVQSYSCAESPFWLGKAFLCLCLPADHPFWTAKEHNGSWEHLKDQEVKTTTLNSPALCYSDHAANGETILRTGKVVKQKNDISGMWNYAKLCYNTKYPWEAASNEKVEAQQYVLEDLTEHTVSRANAVYWCGEKQGVLYRRQFFAYALEYETHWMQALNLADFTVPYGVIRVDQMRLHRCPVTFTLGSYGFPDNGTEVIEKELGSAKAIILKGHDHMGKEKQMAMTIFAGWDTITTLHSTGTNPDSEKSIVIYASRTRKKQYGYEPYLMISQVITKESLDDFTEDELFPIQEILYTDTCGGYGPVTIRMKNGEEKLVDFDQIEGHLEL